MTQELAHPVQDAAATEPPIVLREAPRTSWGASEGLPGREIVAVLAFVVLCDLVIYRGHGFAGYALLFVMWIYVGFNGMTRMRTVGIFGTTTVLAGFVLVLWKIARHRDFGWLVRRQLWVLAMATYLYALTPVDTIVVSYNVRRILAGDPAPSVEISVHPISSEGVLLLRPLLQCSDPIIREGVRAMLAERGDEAESQAQRRQALGWTTAQLADRIVLQGLRDSNGQWSDYRDRDARAHALKAFHDYAYQWF